MRRSGSDIDVLTGHLLWLTYTWFRIWVEIADRLIPRY